MEPRFYFSWYLLITSHFISMVPLIVFMVSDTMPVSDGFLALGIVTTLYNYQVILKNSKKYFFGTQRKLSVENVLQQTGKLKL